MRKIAISLAGLSLILASVGMGFAPNTQAAVTVNSGPTVLAASPITLSASSAHTALFTFTLSNTATETLTSLVVRVDKANASTTVSGSDLASLSLYKDDGSNVFSPVSGNLIGTQATVNIGSTTTITPATTTAASGKFYVSLATSGTWSGNAPADSITVTLPANAITTSENSPTTSAVTTAVITADTTAPLLTAAAAQNTGGTGVKEAGDSVQLTFSEATNKPAITSGNITTFFVLNNGHSFLDSSNNLTSAVWNSTGTILTLTLSGATSSTVPSVMPGDVVTVVSSPSFTDMTGNQVTGTQSITGNFGVPASQPPVPSKGSCNLKNGKLVKVAGAPTVYMVVNCVLRPFTTPAVFHAKGKKFQDIQEIASFIFAVLAQGKAVGNGDDDDDTIVILPTGTASSTLPSVSGLADGSIVKLPGNPTVYMVSGGVLKPFTSFNVFKSHKKNLKDIKTITAQQLASLTVGAPATFPDGALLKGEGNTVYVVKGGQLYGIPSLNTLKKHGYSLGNLLRVSNDEIKDIRHGGIED